MYVITSLFLNFGLFGLFPCLSFSYFSEISIQFVFTITFIKDILLHPTFSVPNIFFSDSTLFFPLINCGESFFLSFHQPFLQSVLRFYRIIFFL